MLLAAHGPDARGRAGRPRAACAARALARGVLRRGSATAPARGASRWSVLAYARSGVGPGHRAPLAEHSRPVPGARPQRVPSRRFQQVRRSGAGAAQGGVVARGDGRAARAQPTVPRPARGGRHRCRAAGRLRRRRYDVGCRDHDPDGRRARVLARRDRPAGQRVGAVRPRRTARPGGGGEPGRRATPPTLPACSSSTRPADWSGRPRPPSHCSRSCRVRPPRTAGGLQRSRPWRARPAKRSRRGSRTCHAPR